MLRWFFGLSLHARIAIMVAPILAIGGYGLADLWATKDQPQQPAHIATLPLELSGQCLLAADQCKLQHGDMQVAIKRTDAGKQGLVRLEIHPEPSVRGVQMSLVQNGEEHRLVVDTLRGGKTWYVEFPDTLITPAPAHLRIALARFGKVFFAEVTPQL